MKEFNYPIREYQLRSLPLLTEIDRVCKAHGLRYYIIAGTLLGAVRHGGFIPWDDDMDIAMMREDYDMLTEHAGEWLEKPFYMASHKSSPLYPKYFAKLEDSSTTVVENRHLGYTGGIYIDIFPLDAVPDSKVLRAFHFYRFNLLRRLLYLIYRNPYKHGKGAGAWMLARLQTWMDRSRLHERVQKVLRECNGKKGCNLVMTHDDGFRAYPRDIFGEPSKIVFEGIEACAPADPGAFLSTLYGDSYMVPPPVEKRVSHFHDYCDFDKPCRV